MSIIYIVNTGGSLEDFYNDTMDYLHQKYHNYPCQKTENGDENHFFTEEESGRTIEKDALITRRDRIF